VSEEERLFHLNIGDLHPKFFMVSSSSDRRYFINSKFLSFVNVSSKDHQFSIRIDKSHAAPFRVEICRCEIVPGTAVEIGPPRM